MNLRQLRYFCAIVESGSAALAAQALFVAPTAISMQLAQLEGDLGGDLFDRSRRPMELTSLGQYLYPRAKELLSNAKRLDDEVKGIAQGKRGWIGIGFVRSANFSLLPDSVRRFRKACPDVHLDLVEVLTEYQPEKLLQKRIDIGISRFIGPFERHPELDYTLIYDDPFVAAIPLDSSLAEQKSVTAAALSAQPFILYPKDARSPFGQQMLTALQLAGGDPVVGYEAVETHTALALVAAGLGVTMVGQSIAKNNRKDVRFLRISDVKLTTTLVVVTRKDDESRTVEAFRSAVCSGSSTRSGPKP
ncbi:LysR family transcriptional regulator [Paraburkholderia sp. J63]|uniref:LysR family transcriptional regulator n=1 Tax=Paraburkholderia sp. J63 TaxID=2805434 RepID=UPI002ABD92DA|nr:LysR family transcriptional regulator [Paraburkholderia sp. J63]